jgi:hypothetical protein
MVLFADGARVSLSSTLKPAASRAPDTDEAYVWMVRCSPSTSTVMVLPMVRAAAVPVGSTMTRATRAPRTSVRVVTSVQSSQFRAGERANVLSRPPTPTQRQAHPTVTAARLVRRWT